MILEKLCTYVMRLSTTTLIKIKLFVNSSSMVIIGFIFFESVDLFSLGLVDLLSLLDQYFLWLSEFIYPVQWVHLYGYH
jgi:hypothetical protein